MKQFILSLALVNMQFVVTAQSDTLQSESKHSLALGINSKDGAFARVTPDDSTKKSSPLVINTQRKKISIKVESRDWASEADSIKDLLKNLRTERRNQFAYWAGIDIGANLLLGANGSTSFSQDAKFMELQEANSRFFAINFFERKFEFGTNHVGLLTGLGWEFTNYRLSNNYRLQFAQDSTYGVFLQSPDLLKNKLRQSGFRMPLMLEFNTKRSRIPTEEEVMTAARDTVGGNKPKSFHPDNKHNFHIAVGAVGTWYYDSMYKVKYRDEGQNFKERDKGDHNLLPYRLAAAVRIGYGSLNLFAEYALTPLFEHNKGPVLTPFTVGLTIVGFN